MISANRTFGVLVLGETATGNRIAGNLIGTSMQGRLPWATHSTAW